MDFQNMDFQKIAIKAAIGIIITAIIAFAAYSAFQHLKGISIERFDVNGITDVTANSFTLSGKMYIKNTGRISVPIETVNYDIMLKDSGQRIGTGTIPTFRIDAEKTTEVPFEQEIKWVPTAELAKQYLAKEHIYLTIKGEVRINLPQLKEYGIPFSQDVDIKDYINQFISEQIQQPIDSPLSAVPNTAPATAPAQQIKQQQQGIPDLKETAGII